MNSNLNTRKNEITLLTDAELDSVAGGREPHGPNGYPTNALVAKGTFGSIELMVWATAQSHGYKVSGPG